MAIIRAFQGIRPKEGLAERIAALPYDVYSEAEAREEVKKEPMSFLKIDRAETQFPEGTDPYSPQVYQKAHDILKEMLEAGEFCKDSSACYYLYELTMDGRSQTGLVACASIDDYLNGVIKKHENTRLDKELDRIRHVDICDAQTGPIFLAYRKQECLQELFAEIREEKAVFDFVSPDGIRHRGWKIQDADDIILIAAAFGKVDEIYIADGHHRAASAVKVGLRRREENPGYTGREEFNYFLSVLFPDEELKILSYNRIVKDLNGQDKSGYMIRLKEVFEVSECAGAAGPKAKGELGMYLDGTWYALKIKEQYKSQDPVDGLDVSVLQNEILGPVLGIEDPKTDKRIDFVGGIRGLEELERRVDAEGGAAFAMYPTSIGELFAVADAGRLMPPKSTWFEPKLRSGLFIHSLK